MLETKQGSSGEGDRLGHGRRGSQGWDKALDRAYHQAREYIRDLPADHGRPPFLIVVDVGHCIDLYAEFTGTGGTYLAFPTPARRRIFLEDLRDPDIRERLRTVWTDPHSLDPSKYAAKVTRGVASILAELATSLEKDGHDPQVIAIFLQRLLFTLFAEDIELLPKKSFEELLTHTAASPAGFATLVTALWNDMATGNDYSAAIRAKVVYFNGGLFENPSALPLNADQIKLLIDAAKQDWKEVEPAIFGTLLERALNPRERHKLGAHYTPRSYVERLIEPTLMAPLRDQWSAVKTAAALLHEQGRDDKARAEIENFHRLLCDTRVLDPACGSGNFLYVALARIKELEAEVLDLLEELGGNRTLEMDTARVRPSQFKGIELNPRAAAIAQLVLWIGYFQWQLKTTGTADTNDRPLLRSENTIECRDAVLDYDERIPRRDPDTGEIRTIWDGRTTKPHPVTGKEAPDETARTTVFDYTNPKRAEWPEADFIVGNPPFIGASRMRDALGDGYTETLRKAWKGKVPDSADLVMFWWHKAAELLAAKRIERFGFITTNSIHQTFNRRVLEPFLANDKKPIHLAYAIPDHPWVDSADGAAVRISMTVADSERLDGVLEEVEGEKTGDDGENDVSLARKTGNIAANLQLGVNTSLAKPLLSNEGISNNGVILGGKDFQVSHTQALALGLENNPAGKRHIRRYLGGSSLTSRYEESYVLDLFGLTEAELQDQLPGVYQWVHTHIRPKRLQNKRKGRRENWWLFNESVPKLRRMLSGLPRFIGTTETAKHRIFSFLEGEILPDHMVISVAHDDASILGILSSRIHVLWSLAQGGTLEDRPRYNKSRCFETFPFPALEEGPLKKRIRDLGEKLDAHRKRQQELHPDLTLTRMYNVLEKLRVEEPLTDKEKNIHEAGLVTNLKQIHDDLDEAVFEAYGWSDILEAKRMLPGMKYDFETGSAAVMELEPGSIKGFTREAEEEIEQELIKRLVVLNQERAEEEKRGLVRWLRPEYQAPDETGVPASEQKQIELEAESASTKLPAPAAKQKWPTSMPDQVAAIQRLLPAIGPDASELAACFGKRTQARIRTIGEILDTLTALGKI
ncbi:hypothetical protein MLD59_11550 [Verrucomicrobiaceae bacterium E54]|nr:hypothetical protein [Verrucomicrobiaceae bacterium E54]